jgi:hypothetical protein
MIAAEEIMSENYKRYIFMNNYQNTTINKGNIV